MKLAKFKAWWDDVALWCNVYFLEIIIVLSIFMLILVTIANGYVKVNDGKEEWYLICNDYSGQSFLVKTKEKPYVSDGVIYIGDEMFLTPAPMMTCKPEKASVIEEQLEELAPESEPSGLTV